MTKKEIIAYSAGFFDGEGGVYIVLVKRSARNYDGTQGKYHRLQIQVTSTDFEILDWFKENFGGWISKHKPETDKWKKAKKWTMADQPAADYLTAIRPYCRIKNKQIDVAIRFRETILENRGPAIGYSTKKGASKNANSMTPQIYELRQELKNELSALNKRGPKDRKTIS